MFNHLYFSSYHVLCYKYCHKAEAEADQEVGEEEWGMVRRHAGVSVTMGDIGDIGDMATIAGILARVTHNSTKVQFNDENSLSSNNFTTRRSIFGSAELIELRDSVVIELRDRVVRELR